MDWQPFDAVPKVPDLSSFGWSPEEGLCLLTWIEADEDTGWQEDAWSVQPLNENMDCVYDDEMQMTHWAPIPTGPAGEPPLPYQAPRDAAE